MKRVVVLLLGIIIGILAGLFFFRWVGAKVSTKITNPFVRAAARPGPVIDLAPQAFKVRIGYR